MGQSGVVISYWLVRVSVFIDSRRGTTLATPSRTHHTAMHTGERYGRESNAQTAVGSAPHSCGGELSLRSLMIPPWPADTAAAEIFSI